MIRNLVVWSEDTHTHTTTLRLRESYVHLAPRGTQKSPVSRRVCGFTCVAMAVIASWKWHSGGERDGYAAGHGGMVKKHSGAKHARESGENMPDVFPAC